MRCVIAAGWAVDDSAALEFAEIFYNRMFGGYAFGDAVLDARKAVFEKYGYTNTWGAYQCYGDPFYSFRQIQFSGNEDKKEYDTILKEITRLWRIAGSKGKRFAEIEHLEFLTDALDIVKNKTTSTLKGKLMQLKTELSGHLNS